ncbi:MAG TPA: hypothetical protein QF353_00870 [Gammaproteobacteria bacterium]|nr:hypothetical protein [Gammaproteobacteria bacterium]
MSDIDFKMVIQNIREAINPEVGVPTDQEKNPINYRIKRLTDLMTEIQTKQQEMESLVQKSKVSFNELLININQQKAPKKTKKSEKK